MILNGEDAPLPTDDWTELLLVEEMPVEKPLKKTPYATSPTTSKPTTVTASIDCRFVLPSRRASKLNLLLPPDAASPCYQFPACAIVTFLSRSTGLPQIIHRFPVVMLDG
jgi:hypothetical protein